MDKKPRRTASAILAMIILSIGVYRLIEISSMLGHASFAKYAAPLLTASFAILFAASFIFSIPQIVRTRAILACAYVAIDLLTLYQRAQTLDGAMVFVSIIPEIAVAVSLVVMIVKSLRASDGKATSVKLSVLCAVLTVVIGIVEDFVRLMTQYGGSSNTEYTVRYFIDCGLDTFAVCCLFCAVMISLGLDSTRGISDEKTA